MSDLDTALRDFTELKNGAAARKETAKPEQPSSFAYISLADLLDQPEPIYRFVVSDLLPVGGTSLLVAKPKLGKTTFGQQLSRNVAGGTAFLGRDVQQGTVLYHAFEEKDTEVARSYRLAHASRELPIYFHFGDTPENQFNALQEGIAQYQPVLVVIDTLAYWMRVRDFNDYAQVGDAMRPLHQIARAGQCHILAIHHSGKGALSGIDSPLGSTALSGNVDTIMSLAEVDGQRVLETRQRYGESMPRTALSFNKETRLVDLGDTIRETRIRALEEDIFEALRGQMKTEAALQSELKCKRENLRLTLDQLVADGVVLRLGKGVSKDPYTYEIAPRYRDPNDSPI